MKKRALLILCAFVIAIGITGCGKKDKEKLKDSSQSSVNSETDTDTIDVGGGEENIPTVDLETGSIISGGKKTNSSDKTTATEDNIPKNGNSGVTSKDGNKASASSNSPSAASSSSSDSKDTSSQSDKQTMEGWDKWKY